MAPFWDREAKALYAKGDHPLNFENLHAVQDFDHHQEIVNAEGPMIILAGSGMCTGGRIVDHLQAGIEDRRNDILFVGYQAGGTLGSDILRYANKPDSYVNIDGKRLDIKAGVHRLTGYSAHADQKGLVDWVRAMEKMPGEVRLVHGEEEEKKYLRKELAVV